MMAVTIGRRRDHDLRQCHGGHRAPRMPGQQDLRPQQRHDREDREAGTQAPVAVSVHGEPETTPVDEQFP